MSRFSSIFAYVVCILFASNSWSSDLDQTAELNGASLEWTLDNSSFFGNPFDLLGFVTFTHSSGEVRTTQMFYASATQWKFRFAPTRSGTWEFVTSSADSELDGHRGTITVSGNSGLGGSLVNQNGSWVESGTARVVAPQYVMFAAPHYYENNSGPIDDAIQEFMVESGFTGLTIPVYCRWFDIDEPSCDSVQNTDPDPATFDALEDAIKRVYAAGGRVHLWMWGDTSRGQNPGLLVNDSGLGGTADLRIQRYVAARLGPLLGWTMGYGYDINEWADGDDVDEWHNNLSSLMGWQHMLGARPRTQEQWSPNLEYASYQRVQPTYENFLDDANHLTSKPNFSEDRFRSLGTSTNRRNLSFDWMNEAVWQSTISGQFANIWGNLAPEDSSVWRDRNEGLSPSLPFPNKMVFRTHQNYFRNRLVSGMTNCDSLTSAICHRAPDNGAMNLYQTNTRTISVDLSSFDNDVSIVAVDTTGPYQEISLGTASGSAHTINLPYSSDWAAAIAWTTDASAPIANTDTLPPAEPENLQLQQD